MKDSAHVISFSFTIVCSGFYGVLLSGNDVLVGWFYVFLFKAMVVRRENRAAMLF